MAERPRRETTEVLGRLKDGLGGLSNGDELYHWVVEREERRGFLEQKVKKQQIDFSTVIEIANQVNSKGLDLKRIESYVISMLRGQFGVIHTFFLRQPSPDDASIAVTAPPRMAKDPIAFPMEGPFSAHLAEAARPLLRDEMAAKQGEFPEFGAFLEAGVELLAPLIHSGSSEGRTLKGVVCLGPRITKLPYADPDRDLVSVLGDMIAISLNNAQLYHRSIVDNLTKVYSRGHFDVHLTQEIARAQRFIQKTENLTKPDSDSNRFVSLVMVDIDFFKKFNDTYGHQTGDKVLQSVAHVLHESVRTMDIVARYGGEEFALVFPETRKPDALNIAERLRSQVESIPIHEETGDDAKVTISLGVATFPGDGDDMRELISRADQALYSAKSGGRNRVVDASTVDGKDG